MSLYNVAHKPDSSVQAVKIQQQQLQWTKIGISGERNNGLHVVWTLAQQYLLSIGH